MADLLSIARPYAKAAFEVAKEYKQMDQWSLALRQLSFASQEKEMQLLLKNPNIGNEKCCEILSVFATEKTLLHFLKVLAENDRLALLPEVSTLFEAMLAKASGFLALTITSAFEMDEAQEKQTEEKLAKQFHSKIRAEFKVDPSIIGGLLVRSEDWVMDATILGQVKRLKHMMRTQ